MTIDRNRAFIGTCSIFALAISGALSVPPAAAQEASDTEDLEDLMVEEMVVTGSRIGGSTLTATSPIVVADRTLIERDRAFNSEEFLAQLPQTSAGIGAASAGNDTFGGAIVDLRGLGQNRTLVLIDGSRGAPFSFRNSVDINSIPALLVERTEVLTGGASTVYGADALVGVVNFVIRDDLEGIEITSSFETSEGGDAEQFGGGIAFGTSIGDRGHIAGFIGYNERDGVLGGDRDFASPEVFDGGVLAFDQPAAGNFTSGANSFSFLPDGTLTLDPQAGEFSSGTSLILPLERINGSVFFGYDILDNVEVYGRAMFTNTTAFTQLEPAAGSVTLTVQDDNPFLTPEIATLLDFDAAGEASVGVARSFTEFGPQSLDLTRFSAQGQLGFRGDINEHLSWDVYAQYGRSDEQTDFGGEILTASLLQAANATVDANGTPVCVDPSGGCAPANLFGVGTISDEAVAFIQPSPVTTREREQFVTVATVSGDTGAFLELPGGAIDWVAGFEYRKEIGDENSGTAFANGEVLGAGSSPPFGGSFDVHEFFFETRIPIIADLPLIQSFVVDGGYRFSNFSTQEGSANTYKIGATWQVDDNIRIRGSFQTAIRSPNVGELFGAQASIDLAPLLGGALFTGDPCSDPATSGASVEQCALFGAPAPGFTVDVGDAPFIFGGNPDLLSETAETYTVGAVFTPTFLPNMVLTIDLYDIEIDGGLFVIFPTDALTSCYITDPTPDNPLCDLVPRGADGQIALADVTDQNVSSFTVRGIDFGLSYDYELPASIPGQSLSLTYNANFVLDQTEQASEFTDVVDCAGVFGSVCAIDSNVQADFRHFFQLNWGFEKVDFFASWERIGDTVAVEGATTETQRLAGQNYVDLGATWRPNEVFQLTFGIDNIFDNEPPLIGTGQEAFNTFPQTFDVIGRTIGLALKVSL